MTIAPRPLSMTFSGPAFKRKAAEQKAREVKAEDAPPAAQDVPGGDLSATPIGCSGREDVTK